ncbi:MAG: cyclodeaminase/cyclohydrolase family protein [Lachnospiraceae bacterium]|nr:cyclodeaminase/cyclohydrolase family protein [Lachnospiraceae bacterium]
MDFVDRSCRDFVEVLSSKEPVPGGGGAAALIGALGTALGNMVGSLTVGKKKYAEVEEELRELMRECNELEKELLDQVEADARGFQPLARAYGIPKEDPDRDRVLEEATLEACKAPIRIMELCSEGLDKVKVFAEKGSVLALSDAGCAAVSLKAAMQAAALNVFINTKSLKDRTLAQEIDLKCVSLMDEYLPLADRIFGGVMGKLRNE